MLSTGIDLCSSFLSPNMGVDLIIYRARVGTHAMRVFRRPKLTSRDSMDDVRSCAGFLIVAVTVGLITGLLISAAADWNYLKSLYRAMGGDDISMGLQCFAFKKIGNFGGTESLVSVTL